jgi:hypothetical protein
MSSLEGLNKSSLDSDDTVGYIKIERIYAWAYWSKYQAIMMKYLKWHSFVKLHYEQKKKTH